MVLQQELANRRMETRHRPPLQCKKAVQSAALSDGVRTGEINGISGLPSPHNNSIIAIRSSFSSFSSSSHRNLAFRQQCTNLIKNPTRYKKKHKNLCNNLLLVSKNKFMLKVSQSGYYFSTLSLLHHLPITVKGKSWPVDLNLGPNFLWARSNFFVSRRPVEFHVSPRGFLLLDDPAEGIVFN